MQMNHVATKSQNFVGNVESVLKDIKIFLDNVKQANPNKSDFHLVHALVFSKEMNETEVNHLNLGLGSVYRKSGFDVLGGDTSSGMELSIFISTIVF